MINKYVIDTQAIIKFLHGDKVFNKRVESILDDADNGQVIILIPSVIIFEIGYLYEKKIIKISIDDISKIINSSDNYIEAKLSLEIIKSSFQITDIPELHDRLIAGTAKYYDIPIITNDPLILKSKYVNCVK